MKQMRAFYLQILLITILYALPLPAQRRIYHLPDLDGRVTLKCDFHLHTVFSDGDVWPRVRVDEAWRDGLDAISITDHLEYQPHKDYIPKDHNAAWRLAEESAREKNILFIRGAEITRQMPPGHLNALFITNASVLDQPDFLAVIEAAVKQGAFILYNHPGWKSQEPDGLPKLYEIHKQLFDKGWLHGIEFYNYDEFYPMVLEFCKQYKLAVIGNSDMHGYISEEYFKAPGDHRPMTLVFARERTLGALREALFEGETLVWYGENLAGRDNLALAFFMKSVTLARPHHQDSKNLYLEMTNHSDISWKLVNGLPGTPAVLTLPAHTIAQVTIAKSFTGPLEYDVENVLTGEKTVLHIAIPHP
ncbi:MAG TPA: Sb-PDE family phosphodiesterase [bacterium]|nr:Sb-PDE family phosphodiesterase [bacterium]HQG46292.1 Sb-PDE family phosphodiesterase [bacterium]HQJ65926.1 Sb-PDE family phosphodiesterase [bacterium]